MRANAAFRLVINWTLVQAVVLLCILGLCGHLDQVAVMAAAESWPSAPSPTAVRALYWHQAALLMVYLAGSGVIGYFMIRRRVIVPANRENHDLRRALKALEESQQRYKILFDAASDAIFLHRTDGTLLDINAVACRRLGYAREALLAVNYSDLTPPEDQIRSATLMEQLSCKRTFAYETVLLHTDRHPMPVEINCRLIEINGDKAILSMARDTSERRRAEAAMRDLQGQLIQAQKLEAIGTLAGGIAHDFNNLLLPISGYAELIRLSLDPGSVQAGQIGEILKAAKRAKEMVRHILAYSRQQAVECRPLQLSGVVEDAFSLLSVTMPSTVQLVCDIQSPDAWVMADPSQMQQVIMNLGTNAYHAMADTGGALTLVLDTVVLNPASGAAPLDLPPGDYVRLSVADTGCGMAPHLIERIYDPYFTTKPAGKGTGLGLSVAMGIVQRHGGRIAVSSRPEHGSRFDIYLPQHQSGKDASAVHAEANGERPRGGGQRVLVIDDDAQVLSSLADMLQAIGYDPLRFATASEALASIRLHPRHFDLVVTDMTMPHMTGIDVAQAVTALDIDLPVVLCTGFSEKSLEQRAREAGVRQILHKPVMLADLARTVATCCRKSPSSTPVGRHLLRGHQGTGCGVEQRNMQ